MVKWSAQKLATPRVEGSHSGHSVFFAVVTATTLCWQPIRFNYKRNATAICEGPERRQERQNNTDRLAGESGMVTRNDYLVRFEDD